MMEAQQHEVAIRVVQHKRGRRCRSVVVAGGRTAEGCEEVETGAAS